MAEIAKKEKENKEDRIAKKKEDEIIELKIEEAISLMMEKQKTEYLCLRELLTNSLAYLGKEISFEKLTFLFC